MALHYTRDNLDNARVQFKVEIGKEVLQKKFNQVYMHFSNQYTLDGFRKGKIPIGILKKKLGNDIQLEVFRMLVSEALDEIIKSENIQFIGDPQFEDISKVLENLVEGQDLKFNFEVEEYSKIIKLGEYKGLEILIPEKEKVTSQEDFESVLQELRLNQAKIGTKMEDEVEKEDIIQIQYYFYFLKNGVEIKGTPKIYNLNLALNNSPLSVFKESFIGLKRSDEKSFLFENPEIEKYVPQDFFKKAQNSSADIHVHIKIMDILMYKLPEIDDELAKDYHCHDLEELKRLVWNKLNLEIKEENQKVLLDVIMKKIIEGSKFCIGNQFINLQMEYHLKYMQEKMASLSITFEDYLMNINKPYQDYLKELREELVFTFKYQFVYNKLLEEIPNKVEKRDIEEELKQYLDTFDGRLRDFDKILGQLQENKEEYSNLIKKITTKQLLNMLVQENRITYSNE